MFGHQVGIFFPAEALYMHGAHQACYPSGVDKLVPALAGSCSSL